MNIPKLDQFQKAIFFEIIYAIKHLLDPEKSDSLTALSQNWREISLEP